VLTEKGSLGGEEGSEEMEALTEGRCGKNRRRGHTLLGERNEMKTGRKKENHERP